MKKALFTAMACALLIGCKKKVSQTHSEVIGTWHWINWCDSNDKTKKDLNIDTNGKGSYYIHNSDTGEETVYSGTFKTKNNDVYLDREFVFTIVEVVDTSGTISNPNASFCGVDSIQVSGLLRIINEAGVSETYWKP